MSNVRSTYWALVAVACYAAQHPFVQPFASLYKQTWSGVSMVAACAELVGLVILAFALLFKRQARLMWREMTAGRKNRNRTVRLAVIGTASGTLYSYAIANTNPVYLSLILNLYPIYALIVTCALNRKFPPANTYVTSAIGAIGLTLTGGLAGNSSNVQELISTFLFCSCIPVLFSIRQYYFSKWFSGDGELYRVTVLSAFDAPLIFSLWFGLSIKEAGFVALPSAEFWKISLFLIGTAISGIVGQSALQKALRYSHKKEWYPMSFFFLVPLLVALYGLALQLLGGSNSAPYNRYYWIGVFSLLLATAFHYWANSEQKGEDALNAQAAVAPAKE